MPEREAADPRSDPDREPTLGLAPADEVQVAQVIALVEAVLGPAVLGAALTGSAVEGTLRAGSDLDILVVSARSSSVEERRRLIAGLLPMSGRRAAAGPARSIELTIVVQSAVRPWRYPPSLDFQYGDWWRAEFEGGDVAPWDDPNPDLAVLLTAALHRSRRLAGRPVTELLGPVPRDDLVRATVDGIPGLLADLQDDTRNVILTLARIWVTVATGEIRSKDAAAAWVLDRLPAARRAPLARARAEYVGDMPTADWQDAQPAVERHVEVVVKAIRGLVDGSSSLCR